ncbi:MAG TPA: BsuPI-related putative proteinase inhibitor [Frankiaceae bacterium]|nr:BsuPI-related putative proteinase inhibitor [Frankiaceae bacterium]
MTDLPRRAYPLVVPPPGGFEDAVRRGRGFRRRRAGGSTGAALVIAGLVAYSSLHGSDAGTKGLQPTDDVPGVEQPAPATGAGSPTPDAVTSSPAPRTGDRPKTVAGGPASAPATSPSAGPVAHAPGQRPTRPPAPRPDNPRRYAPRGDINEGEPQPNPVECLPTADRLWCATAIANPVGGGSNAWTLGYTLCRALDEETGTVTFDRKQEAEYSIRHVDSGETIWTWSAGQPVVRASSSSDAQPGECITWSYTWNGYDDFLLTPQPGLYRLTASSTGRSDTGLPTDEFDFTIEDE